MRARVTGTPPLRRFERDLRYEIPTLARLHADGLLEIESAWLPPLGPCTLVLWRPEGDPAFQALTGRIARRGRGFAFEGAAAEGWVVLRLG